MADDSKTDDDGEFESPAIVGSFGGGFSEWRTMSVDNSQEMGSFSMCVDIKKDGRIHYTGVMAKDLSGNVIFEEIWGEKGEWETVSLS